MKYNVAPVKALRQLKAARKYAELLYKFSHRLTSEKTLTHHSTDREFSRKISETNGKNLLYGKLSVCCCGYNQPTKFKPINHPPKLSVSNLLRHLSSFLHRKLMPATDDGTKSFIRQIL